ncbi:uncharacterized protein (TIGR00106 family) [Peptoniphilus koenoeneniae]|uniref:Uncharacterized protein (TIGR00106 family) n=1 Tax=Peptoniphilus koenoeneniae TaxID=507751 RepID=A0ABU0AW90_9FIRM|nr:MULTISPECIES: MTH1187 family thiamine-binding protein [Peptoniphilus]ERT57370.1 hypothetical protein HMPREF1253_1650 [Peptoniphilus sp. BV3C26]MDQ0275077.1 uncharacterized protein (TIGR00106 family) [Peptoniphilus koenoeneniae]
MKVCELTLVPLGQGTSCSKYVAGALDSIKDMEGIQYELNPMGTVIAAEELSTLYKAIEIMQESVFKKGANRVYSVIKIDDRRDKERDFHEKIKSVEEKLEK